MHNFLKTHDVSLLLKRSAMNKYGQKLIQAAVITLGIWAALEIFKSVESAEEIQSAVDFALSTSFPWSTFA